MIGPVSLSAPLPSFGVPAKVVPAGPGTHRMPGPLNQTGRDKDRPANPLSRGGNVMLYLVEGHPTIDVGDRVDAGEGPHVRENHRAVPSPGFLRQPDTASGFYDRRAQYAGGDRGADVRPELVVEDRTDLHSDYAARHLRRGNR